MIYYNGWRVVGGLYDSDVQDILPKYSPKNKNYEKMKNKGYFASKIYKLYYLDKNTNTVHFPKGILDQLNDWDIKMISNDSKSNTISLPQLNCTPYDHQWELINRVKDKSTGLIVAREGRGKTIAMAAMVHHKQVRTLIVVPLKGIADGMVQKMRLYFGNDKVSIYKPGNDITDITICVGPTFNKYWRQFSGNFDMLIVDEAHMNFIHVGAAKKKGSEFTDRMQIYCQFECKHFFGFTATPESNDVNNDSFEYVFGKKYVAEGHQPTPTVLTHKYYTGIEMFRDWQHLQEILLDNDDRISNLCDRVKEVMQYRWMGVVFCDRIEMVNKVCDMLKTIGVESRAYTSKSQKRDELVASLRGKNGVIVSTYQTLKAGVDYPELDTAFYFMGVKFSATVKQLVGRILRVEKGKKIPIMIDFVDDVMPMYLQSRQRVKAYKERGWGEPLKYDASIVKDLSSKVL